MHCTLFIQTFQLHFFSSSSSFYNSKMERATPVRKPHTSTADMLTWSDQPPTESPSTIFRSGTRSHQPSDGISKVVFGGQITEEEAESLNKRKPPSGYKLKEQTGSGIFATNAEPESDNSTLSPRTMTLRQRAVNGISQISFSTEESITPKKVTSIAEVAKQRALSGTLGSEGDTKPTKQLSNAKCKELSGNDIFGPPPEITPRPLATPRPLESKDIREPAPRNIRTSVKVSNPSGGQSNILFSEEPEIKTTKPIHNQKLAQLTGNDIFKGVDAPPPGSTEKPLSSAKLREISGNNIFADGKADSREHFAGVRKPPGGGSTISLV